MFFKFLTFILPPFGFRVFFRRIFYSNLQRVPLEKPLLLVGNHQNSFLDGMLVGAYLTKPINFLMRADMFVNPAARFCLKELNVSPIYRFEEGLENVHKNKDTFKYIYDVLSKNGNYVVFAEGICVQEKRLQKLRKGTARMAFGAEEAFGIDVNIVPVGVNYTYPATFRQEVMINFDDAFSIKEFKELYETHPAKALLAFNEKVEAGLLRQVIIVKDPANDWLAEQLLVMGRNDMILPFFRWRFDGDERRQMEKMICDKINHLSENSKDDLRSLTEKVRAYTTLLKKHKLSDDNIARRLDWGFIRYLAVIAGLPVFVVGYLVNLIPNLVPPLVCNSIIRDKRFYSSIYIGIGTGLYLIYFPVVMILAIVYLGWWGIIAGLLVPVTGYLALFYKEILMERIRTTRFIFKKMSQPELVKQLFSLRKEISDTISAIRI
jgi:1-acyl-sn-glycerol-3-phosphate acyltransferase